MIVYIQIFDNTYVFIAAGGLSTNYVLDSILVHWGATAVDGSEHTEHGRRHTLEVSWPHDASYDLEVCPIQSLGAL